MPEEKKIDGAQAGQSPSHTVDEEFIKEYEFVISPQDEEEDAAFVIKMSAPAKSDNENALGNAVPEEMRPRERFLAEGARKLDTRELLAILLRTGTKDRNVLMMADDLLKAYKGRLRHIANEDVKNLSKKVPGLGPVKSIELLTSLELGRRMLIEPQAGERVTCSKDTYETIRYDVEYLEHEEVWVIMLSNSNGIIKKECFSTGGWTSSTVDIRMLMSKILQNNAPSFIMVHNHPSGVCRPSRQDDLLTEDIVKAAKVLRLNFRDHLIIARGNGYYSYLDSGKL